MDKSVFSNPELTLAEKGFYATIKTFPEMSLEELRQEQNFLKVSLNNNGYKMYFMLSYCLDF